MIESKLRNHYKLKKENKAIKKVLKESMIHEGESKKEKDQPAKTHLPSARSHSNAHH